MRAKDFQRTKYIYGSRKAWRVPSFIDKVDEEFFEPYGNFSGVRNFNKLLSALLIDEAKHLISSSRSLVTKNNEALFRPVNF